MKKDIFFFPYSAKENLKNNKYLFQY